MVDAVTGGSCTRNQKLDWPLENLTKTEWSLYEEPRLPIFDNLTMENLTWPFMENFTLWNFTKSQYKAREPVKAPEKVNFVHQVNL